MVLTLLAMANQWINQKKKKKVQNNRAMMRIIKEVCAQCVLYSVSQKREREKKK